MTEEVTDCAVVEPKKKVGRKPKSDLEYAEKMKAEAKCWAKTKLYCPHCNKIFNHESMWRAIARDIGNVEKIKDFIGASFKTIRNMVRRYKLHLYIENTLAQASWETIALRAGYHTPAQMFWDLKISRQLSYKVIAGLLGMPNHVGIVKEACKTFLNPYMKKNKKPIIPNMIPKERRRGRKARIKNDTEEEKEKE